MKIEIKYNRKIIKQYLSFLANNVDFFKRNEMFYYFPFDRKKIFKMI